MYEPTKVWSPSWKLYFFCSPFIIPRKFWPMNSPINWGPVYLSVMPWEARMMLARSAHASNASSSESTRVLSQSKRMWVICSRCNEN